MGKLDGRVALVTGAARGQGEAEARLFAANGARVMLADVLDDAGRAVAADIGGDASYVHLDVRSEQEWAAAVQATVDAFGALDALVNNAGILRYGPMRSTSLDDYRAVVDVNQVGVFLGMRAVVEPMVAAGGGTIVNTSSVNGFTGVPNTIAYAASKFAVRGMTKVAAVELGPLGIRVNSIHPGSIDTPMVRPDDVVGLIETDPDEIYRKLPLGRIGRTDEIARLALFLSCEDSSYCTGAEFIADGGMLAGPGFD